MGITTEISWARHTFSPWIGCSPVHTGCQNCYAKSYGVRFGVVWGPNGTRRRTARSTWKQPLRWNREAAASGERPRVFPSLCDPFEERDDLALIRRDFFRLIDETPNLDWLLLTKRPENIRKMWPFRQGQIQHAGLCETYRPNVWLLYSASDQATLEAGLPHLLACRDLVPVLGLSAEPLIGPVDILSALEKYNVHQPNIGNGVRGSVPSGMVSRRRDGGNMASEKISRWRDRTADNRDAEHPDQGGNDDVARISKSAIQMEWQTTVDLCTPGSVVSSHGTNQMRDGDQSQGREPGEQCDIESGGSNAGGQHETFVSCDWQGNKEPKRRSQHFGKADTGGHSGDTGNGGVRDDATGSRPEIQDIADNGVRHCASKNMGIDWVIAGGESGPNARPCNVDWLRSIRDQCREAGVPCFIKQLGSSAEEWDASRRQAGTGPYIANLFRDSKGADWLEWPEDMRVRQMPRIGN